MQGLKQVAAVQAFMPAEHLASQAAEGASSLQQLNALAALHARIASGQLFTASELHVQQPDLRLKRDAQETFSSQISPSGTSAIVFWKAVRQQERSVTVLGLQDGAIAWRRHQLHSVPSMAWSAG